LCFTPFFHVMGFVANCVFNICAAVPVNVQSSPQTQKLSPELLLAACASLTPSMVNTVPWVVEGIAQIVDKGSGTFKAVINQPEIVSYGGAALPTACSEIMREAGAKIMCTYGQTELGGPVLFGRPEGNPNALIPWVKYELQQSLGEAEDEGELVLADNLSTTTGYLEGKGTAQGKLKPPALCRTGDRFRKISASQEGLIYVCRKDDLMKHATGEFTNPLVTEHAMMNACVGTLHAACMVGNNRPRPWLLLEVCDHVNLGDAACMNQVQLDRRVTSGSRE